VIEKNITIINKYGLHARAAAKFVTAAGAFQSDISLRKDADWVDGKSIMSVMMLAASQGTSLQLRTEGRDEADAMAAIELLIANRFDEEE